MFVSYIQYIKTAIKKLSYSNAASCIMLYKFCAVSLSTSNQEYISRVDTDSCTGSVNRVNDAPDNELKFGTEL